MENILTYGFTILLLGSVFLFGCAAFMSVIWIKVKSIREELKKPNSSISELGYNFLGIIGFFLIAAFILTSILNQDPSEFTWKMYFIHLGIILGGCGIVLLYVKYWKNQSIDDYFDTTR